MKLALKRSLHWIYYPSGSDRHTKDSHPGSRPTAAVLFGLKTAQKTFLNVTHCDLGAFVPAALLMNDDFLDTSCFLSTRKEHFLSSLFSMHFNSDYFH